MEPTSSTAAEIQHTDAFLQQKEKLVNDLESNTVNYESRRKATIAQYEEDCKRLNKNFEGVLLQNRVAHYDELHQLTSKLERTEQKLAALSRMPVGPGLQFIADTFLQQAARHGMMPPPVLSSVPQAPAKRATADENLARIVPGVTNAYAAAPVVRGQCGSRGRCIHRPPRRVVQALKAPYFPGQ